MNTSTQGDATLTGIERPKEGTDSAPPGSLSKEVIFDILSNHRRRYLLEYLRENDSESDLRTLSVQIAAWENDTEPNHVSSKQRMRAYTALRQSHLPKMDRQGIIEFDLQSGSVKLTPTATEIEEYLDSVDTSSSQFGTYYLLLGVVGLLFSAGTYSDLSLFGVIPDVVAGIIVSVILIAGGIIEIMGKRH